nr:hypothetical protein Iba_chr04eCG12750 [Ipomoea batatas]
MEVKMWSDKELTGVYEQINTVVYDEGHDTFYYWIILCEAKHQPSPCVMHWLWINLLGILMLM